MSTTPAPIPPASTANAADLHVDQVHQLLEQLVAPQVLSESSTAPLHACLGRVLAQDVISPLNVPPHDNSAMDGYAFASASLSRASEGAGTDAPVQLHVAGTVLAGHRWTAPIAADQALRIMTGAVMPAGCDTVIPQELCQRDGDTVRFAANALQPGANRRRAGEDLAIGQCALSAGTRLGPAALGLMASLGLAQAPILRPLRAALLSTGDELVRPGEALRPGAIYDSNRYTLQGLLTRLGCEVRDLGLIGDDPARLEHALRDAAQNADVIITSAGVSLGDADHTRRVLERLGEVGFWRVAMRPGRPLAVGKLTRHSDDEQTDGSAQGRANDGDNGGALLFGLPGNPVAAMVCFLVFVRPALLRLMGCDARSIAAPPMLRAVCTQAIRKRPGRTEYLRGWVQNRPNAMPEVSLAPNQGSGMLSGMQAANALVVMPHESTGAHAGAEVDVLLLDALI